ncbi:MAG: PQQ-binding-like beta-propeller repeat protein [Planctomycetota bacterium]
MSLRIWPGVLLVIGLWGFLTLPNIFLPESPRGFMLIMPGLFGSIALLFAWWLFASRVPWIDRLVGLGLVVGGLALGITTVYDASLRGVGFIFFIVPWVLTGLVGLLLASKPLGWHNARKIVLPLAIAVVGAPAMVAYEGANSNFAASFRPRWEPSPEQVLLADLGADATAQAPTQANATAGADPEAADAASGDEPAAVVVSEWPGFRGPGRDGVVLGGSLAVDWSGSAPRELWRRAVGPAWSSFAIASGLAYTQEQRGDQDCVVAYDAATGEQVWSTGVEARFEESIAGPGPRATPTYFEGSVYATGGDGDVQRLDAITGEAIWIRNLLDDTTRESPPEWGYASSPLLVTLDDGRSLAIVFANNPKPTENAAGVKEAVVAYDAASGDIAWKAGVGYHSYSSPHLATLSGVPQVLMVTNLGLESLDPATGDRLWLYAWDINEFPRSIQPLVVDEQTVILSAGYDSGTMLFRVTSGAEGWQTEELWDAPSQELVPYFNDMVLHEGHLYAIHKKFLVCVNLESGEPTWPRRVKRKSKVGNGQLVLDPKSGMLLVTTEDTGEALLVEANPETLVIRSRLPTVNDDRNWNHPVVAGGRLYVRHGSEAVCFELPTHEVASR